MNFVIPFLAFPSDLTGWLLFAGAAIAGILTLAFGFPLLSSTKRRGLGMSLFLLGVVGIAISFCQILLPTQAAPGKILAEQAATVYGVDLDISAAHQLRMEVSAVDLENGKGDERWESDPVETELGNTPTFLKLVWDTKEWILVSYNTGEATELDRL